MSCIRRVYVVGSVRRWVRLSKWDIYLTEVVVIGVPPIGPGEDVAEAPGADEALAFGGCADWVLVCHFG